MNIFESLENLEVSEECFNDIMGIVEEILSEDELHDTKSKRRNSQLNAKKKTKEAKELKKQRDIADRKEQISYGDAVTLKDLADYHEQKSGRESEETKNVRSNAADAIRKNRADRRELKKVASAYNNAVLDARKHELQANAAQRKVDILSGNN